MRVPKSLLYSEEHIWVSKKGNKVKIGVTEFLVSNSGEIKEVKIDEDEGNKIEMGDVIGEIVTDDGSFELISPVSGKILHINQDIMENPQIILESPYKDGWIVEIEIEGNTDIEEYLLNPKEYEDFLREIEE